MTIGLTKDELTKLSSFGGTPEERIENVYHLNKVVGKDFAAIMIEIIDNMGGALQRKMVDLISKNNDRIAKQLKETGINLI